MTPSQLSDAVLRAARGAAEDGELGQAGPDAVPARFPLRRPPHDGGDGGAAGERWATGIALKLAGPAGMDARRVAEVLRARLRALPGVRGVEIGGPGFLTVTLPEEAANDLISALLARPRPVPHPEDTARDIARWAAATGWRPDDPRLLIQREPDNPLFLVRYAHARARAVERGAAALGVRPEPGAGAGGSAYGYPYRSERALLAALGESDGGREAVPSVLTAVGDALLETERERPALPCGDEKPQAAHRARLALAQAAGTVLAGGLHRLGVCAPELL
ncbi:arginine--tRNA ligase [Streptomyces sp. 7-21]|uniref:arginine--tRNA ligase n=1 Tax=Streptomyces sp. 7-21 TaxID=2802283 RepID=UPI00191F9BFF|nr:arginine--tRNA ligase [Streptomyces sp. 7-21]MBL1065320.1 arginine--tRNA ligase [Streptomyces sp. 7-21]